VYFLVNNAQRAEGAATDPLPLTSTIDFIATAIPEEEFLKAPMERNPLLTSTLVSSVKRRWNAGRYAYPFWNPIPYYPQPDSE